MYFFIKIDKVKVLFLGGLQMPEISFFYEKKDGVYFLYAALKKQEIILRVTASERGWNTTYTPSSKNEKHPYNNQIYCYLRQHVFFEISQNESLKEELCELTQVPYSYKEMFEKLSDSPFILHLSLKPESFTEKDAKIEIRFKIYHECVEEIIKVIYQITNEGFKFLEMIRGEELKKLEKEGFPFHPLSDEQVIECLNNDQSFQQSFRDYILFIQKILAVKQASFTPSFSIKNYEKYNQYQEFDLTLEGTDICLTAEFTKNVLTFLSFEMKINNDILHYSSEQSMFVSFYEQLHEFITKKSIYRTRFFF